MTSRDLELHEKWPGPIAKSCATDPEKWLKNVDQ